MAYKNTLLIYEVLEKVSLAKTREEKIKILRENDTWALKDVLRGSFDDSITWLLPQGGPPPYQPAEPRSVPSNLLKQHKQFTYFVKGGKGTQMLAVKRESMFIRLLEQIHPKDAEVLIDMINKKSPAKSLTKKLVQEAFPTLIVR